MKENHKFKIGDHVMHMPTGTHTVWEISGYSENGYRVKEHLDSVRILYEKEDEWELYDSDKYQSLINNKELCLERKTKQTTDIIKVLAKEKRPPSTTTRKHAARKSFTRKRYEKDYFIRSCVGGADGLQDD